MNCTFFELFFTVILESNKNERLYLALERKLILMRLALRAYQLKF